LYSALPYSQSAAAWLADADVQAIARDGVHDFSHNAAQFFKRLLIPTTNSLLLLQANSVLHQFYVCGKRLALARQVLLTAQDKAATARQFADEAGKLENYLRTQRVFAAQDQPDIYLLLDTQTAACLDTQPSHWRIVDSAQACARLGLTTSGSDSDVERLFVAHLLSSKPGLRLGPFAGRRRWLQTQWRRGIYGLSAALLLISLPLGMGLAKHIHRQADDNAALRAGLLPVMAPAPERQHQAELGLAHQRLNALADDPLPMLKMISQVLDQHPAVQIDELGWEVPAATAAGPFDATLSLRYRAEPNAQAAFMAALRQDANWRLKLTPAAEGFALHLSRTFQP
jgi:hypothetical protein